MIKILFFIEKLAYNGAIGGAEKALITLVNHMDPSQFDITVQTVFPDDKACLLNNNIQYRYCYARKKVASTLRYRIETELGLTYPLHIKEKYDIEVAFLEFDSTKVIAASDNREAKKVAWVHCDFKIAVKDKRAFVAKTTGVYKKFDKIVCVSELCKKSFIELFGNEYDVTVLHNVIDEKGVLSLAYDPLPEEIVKSKYTICSVGNFTPAKNHIRLLYACKKLAEEGYKFDLWIIGDGALRSKIEEFIHKNQMQNYVYLFGFQENPYPFMKQADLLVCSSDYEGYSTSIVEGVIIGKRIITTDCSGMHEILDGYEWGTIVKNDDDSFTEGLRSELASSMFEGLSYTPFFIAQSAVLENELFFKNLL